MTSLITLDGKIVESVPAALALYPYGCFTTFLVEERSGLPAVLAWDAHLERLAEGTRELWGHALDTSRVERALLAHLDTAGTGSRSVRVTLYPEHFSMAAPEAAAGVQHLISSAPVPAPGLDRAGLGTGNQVAASSGVPAFRVLEVPFQRHRAHLKSTDLLGQIAARREARLAGYDDAVLSSEGRLLEGTTWSLIAWFSDRAVTPVGAVLASTTVSVFAEVAHQIGRPLTTGELTSEALLAADLVLGVSVLNPCRPLTQVGGRSLHVDEELLGQLVRGHDALPRHSLR